jgi:hypothetical protein
MRERKPAYGIGINDADYAVSTEVNGKRVTCPFYRAWHNMLKRCYSEASHAVQPTYKECGVCDEWLIFSRFRSWMEKQDWRGKELDKDILRPGNKVYSPDNCMFVTRQINSLLHVRGDRTTPLKPITHVRQLENTLPQGVWFDLGAGKFRAEFTANGKKHYVGLFRDSRAAALAYRKAKAAHIKEVAMQQEPRLRDALIRHSEALLC